ncbi:DUF2996 domain-containing protein [Plectonema cf. radiosum LEGE 06105]|uniref:DUF2996 domain-containing protein n=1 Tax=Plectonema cf. radiosum LEGE 06105 TaxID=945769 RepID=A0A8J7JVN5_9CYAN|nr:DUF2996 domain-containing protein [Plectonema radiosum]MBE9216014.1 DUF2996 domain-containing protein [Plectonema cf. radiosum LEGE 06105]
MAEETNKNETGDAIPSTVEEKAPEVARNAPSTDSPETTDIPSANAPDPKAASGDNPNAAKAKPAAKAAGDKKPAAAKKEKPPAVEDKPFEEFMRQHYVPALATAIAGEGVEDLHLDFAKQKLNIPGYEKESECWQVLGNFRNGLRQFNVYFPDEDIKGKKAFSCNEGKTPSTLESFLIDERRITLDLMVFGVVQRLNGQKWLGRN